MIKERNTEKEICEAELRKNIVLVETGGELTRPLSVLNNYCDFKKVWDETFNKWHKEEIYNERKEYIKEYYQRPEVKAKRKEYTKKYYQRPEVKAKKKKYNKEYRQRPEVKAKKLRK